MASIDEDAITATANGIVGRAFGIPNEALGISNGAFGIPFEAFGIPNEAKRVAGTPGDASFDVIEVWNASYEGSFCLERILNALFGISNAAFEIPNGSFRIRFGSFEIPNGSFLGPTRGVSSRAEAGQVEVRMFVTPLDRRVARLRLLCGARRPGGAYELGERSGAP